MRNNLWNKKRGNDGLWFNQTGGCYLNQGGPNVGVGLGIGVPATPLGLSATTTNPNNSNGLTPGSVPGTGTSCGCDYSMNCWDNNNPATLSNYPGQSSATCPAGTSLTEPNNSVTTYSGTCYDSACPGNGSSYNNLPTNACPGGTQLTQPTCTPTTCYTGACNPNGTAVVGASGWNGNCPGNSTTSQPFCQQIVLPNLNLGI